MRSLILLFCAVCFVACNDHEKKIPESVKAVISSSSGKISPSDSTYLKMILQAKVCKIFLLNDSLITNDVNDFDKFISQHRQQIDDRKILLIALPSRNIERFKQLKAIMRKNELFSFRIVSNPDNDQ